MHSNVGRVARFCPYCGSLRIEGARFCSDCGSPMAKLDDDRGEPPRGAVDTANQSTHSPTAEPITSEPGTERADDAEAPNESAPRPRRIWVIIVGLATVVSAVAGVLTLIIR
jgi:hypothetical protein